MTVQTNFISWQTSPKQPDPKACSPCCGSWWQYLRVHWGGQHLGCYVRRPIVGGTALSSHGSGAAIDWRYESPGVGRQRMLDETMPWLIGNSKELGLQAIHDYAGKRIWRPPGTSGRPPTPGAGWKSSTGPQMNYANKWLHLEVHPARWSDGRTVDEMLGTSPEPPTPEPPTPEPPPSGGTFTLELQKTELTPANRAQTRGNGDVYLFQQIAAGMYKQSGNEDLNVGKPDGDYGDRSQKACRVMQALCGLKQDAECGPATWSCILNKDGR